MIAQLTGRLLTKGEDHVLLEVGGIGFKVRVPGPLLDQADLAGTVMTLHTHLHVRENDLSLYGFATEEDLSLFALLLGVSGIGPKMALSALGVFTPEQLRKAITLGDALALTRVAGIGRRTAERLILDLRDKVGVCGDLGAGPFLSPADAEVIEALTSLGYSIAEAQVALRAMPTDDAPVEERIRLALRYFAGE